MTIVSTDTGPTALILMTSFNREEQTLRSLAAVEAAAACTSVVLADASTTSGTARMVAESFPAVKVLPCSSDTYWASGMRTAQEYGLRAAPGVASVVWLNDDTLLYPGALDRTLHLSSGEQVAVVGCTKDPLSGAPSYGGLLQSSPRSTRFVRLGEVPVSTACDAGNGNLVVFPRTWYEAVGGIPEAYVHGLADIVVTRRIAQQYGLIQSGGFVGECLLNREPMKGADQDAFRVFGPKALPVKPWWHYCLETAGLIRAPKAFLAGYAAFYLKHGPRDEE